MYQPLAAFLNVNTCVGSPFSHPRSVIVAASLCEPPIDQHFALCPWVLASWMLPWLPAADAGETADPTIATETPASTADFINVRILFPLRAGELPQRTAQVTC